MQETVVGLGNVNAIAVAGRASVVFRLIARYHCECASANHGGLTPPLLCRTNARLLGIFDFRCTRVTQPRGADAPRSCVARMRVCWGFAVSAARVLPSHGGLTPPLLVVHAFVHRESRHFTGKRSRLQTGAAGVSPPWCTETHLQGRYRKHAGNRRRWAGGRYCNRGHRGSVGSVPSHCAVALRMRFGEPRGANAPRSWLSVACR
jgi:hypothetical protein